MVKPFKINIPDKILKNIKKKVEKFPWHEMPNNGGWEYGANLDYMKNIAKYQTLPSIVNFPHKLGL